MEFFLNVMEIQWIQWILKLTEAWIRVNFDLMIEWSRCSLATWFTGHVTESLYGENSNGSDRHPQHAFWWIVTEEGYGIHLLADVSVFSDIY